jgi:hypothetical protein
MRHDVAIVANSRRLRKVTTAAQTDVSHFPISPKAQKIANTKYRSSCHVRTLPFFTSL